MATAESTFEEKLRSSSVKPPVADATVKEHPYEFPAQISLRNIFTFPESHPIIIDLTLRRSFGPEWFEWEPETLWDEIQRVFQSQISEHGMAKVQALKTLRLGDIAWRSWPVFEKIIQILDGNLPDWGVMQAPGLDTLFVGVDILEQIEKRGFSDEVKNYMAAAVLNEDVFFVPPPLDFIQAEVAQPFYKCLDCGNENQALFHDRACDHCLGRFRSGEVLYEVNQETKRTGTNLEGHVKYDPSAAEKRWHEVEKIPTSQITTLQEVPADVQVSHLLLARDHMNMRRHQLIEQILALKSWLGTGAER